MLHCWPPELFPSLPPHLQPCYYLEKNKEFKDATKGGWEEAGIGHSHLEEKCMEQTVADIDKRVLVEVADTPVIPSRGCCPTIIVQWMVVVGLIL